MAAAMVLLVMGTGNCQVPASPPGQTSHPSRSPVLQAPEPPKILEDDTTEVPPVPVWPPLDTVTPDDIDRMPHMSLHPGGALEVHTNQEEYRHQLGDQVGTAILTLAFKLNDHPTQLILLFNLVAFVVALSGLAWLLTEMVAVLAPLLSRRLAGNADQGQAGALDMLPLARRFGKVDIIDFTSEVGVSIRNSVYLKRLRALQGAAYQAGWRFVRSPSEEPPTGLQVMGPQLLEDLSRAVMSATISHEYPYLDEEDKAERLQDRMSTGWAAALLEEMLKALQGLGITAEFMDQSSGETGEKSHREVAP
ncbi:hypothetical protein [Azospirillum sp. B4]|uniref:hypothetical protein n=1 Tax=Azospirillum sp. B4 TaxID=95605 RepID=UPI0011DD9727|nr:hypothetical protein [Azospirillum sp. B4]